jgi:hypothetical protein
MFLGSDHNAAGRIKPIENYPLGTQTCNLLACCIMPQPTAARKAENLIAIIEPIV